MPLKIGTDQPHPSEFWNVDELQLRMQIFLIVRDEDDRVCMVREKDRPNVLNLPGETVPPNKRVETEVVDWIGELWFTEPLEAEISQIMSWPAEEPGGKWYVVFVFEADKPDGGLSKPDDTEEFVWASTKGDPPGELSMNHTDIWERLEG